MRVLRHQYSMWLRHRQLDLMGELVKPLQRCEDYYVGVRTKILVCSWYEPDSPGVIGPHHLRFNSFLRRPGLSKIGRAHV